MEASYAMIVIIAVTITLAFVAVYWLISLQSITTEVEYLELVKQKVIEKNGYYEVNVVIENKGIKKASIINILINEHTPENYSSTITPQNIELDPGEKIQVKITLPKSEFDHGQAVSIKLISAKGNEFPILIYIP